MSMGVSMGRSGARVYLPFWIAVPFYLCAAAGWLIYYLVVGLAWLVMAGVRAVRHRA
jgi:hypothetical protein